MIPTVEIHVAGQRPQIIKKGLARRQVRAQQLVLQVEQLQQRVEQQRQDVQGR